MIRRLCLSATFVMLAAPAFAAAPDATCMEPTLPTMPNGRTAPAADIIAAATAVKAYVADSDTYQTCLKTQIDGIDQMEAKAKADKKDLDPKLKGELDKDKVDMAKKGEANQAKKEQLGASYAAVAAAYRASHPPAKR